MKVTTKTDSIVPIAGTLLILYIGLYLCNGLLALSLLWTINIIFKTHIALSLKNFLVGGLLLFLLGI